MRPTARAIESVLQIDTKTLTTDWHNAEFEAFRPIAEATKMPAAFARPLITQEKHKGNLNLGPELSPDGSRLIYFSERDMFSIDLFVADARTGEVIKKITNTATSAHYDSLSFLTSAGSWDPAGKRFVFPAISKGDATLNIVDVERGRTEREIKVKEANEIVNPAWSPDGKQIVFSGLIGGFTDLFVYDLEKDTERRLTSDAYAEMDPAWSPDGKGIAFSTDRFTTNLETIKPGRLRLALMDVSTGAVTELGGFADAKNISPHWAPDGRSILLPVGPPGHHEHLPHGGGWREDHAAHQHADRRERHHGAQPGHVVRRRPPRLQRLRERRLQHLRARHRRTAGRRGVR